MRAARGLFAWLRTRRLAWAAVAAVLAAVCAAVAFQTSPSDVSTVAASGALAATGVYLVAWVGRVDANAADSGWQRLGRFLALFLLSVLALLSAIVGVAVLFGRQLIDSAKPVGVAALDIGLLVFAAFMLALLACWAWSFQRNLLQRPARPRWWLALPTAAAAVGVGCVLLAADTVPNQLDLTGLEQAREAGNGRYDLLVVVDPADAASRQLIAAARGSMRSGDGDAPFPPPATGSSYEVAYGLALVNRRHGDKPLWRLVEPPTTDRRELTDALARIGPRAGAPAATSYGRLLYDLLDDEQVRWRAGAQRGVVFLLRDLPSQRELDGSPGASADAIPVDGDWTRACSRFLDAWEPREVAADRAQAVRWGDALAKHCERNAARREWQLNGRLAERPAPHSVALHAFTGERRPRRTHAWTGWANALDGTFARHRPAHGPVDAVRLLREARDAQTGVPFGELKRLTEIFQPHVRFDESEQFLPVDVDRLLTEGGHRVCDRHGAGGCERVASARDLTGALDEFLDLSGGARGGRDLVGRSDPSRMYVHVREHRGQVYLGYWWFQRFNSSPWRPEVNCLPGLTSSVSCFDHEGDWEGVTVVLDLVRERLMHHRYARANVEPVAALYDSHGHPIRWRWDDLERTADDGSAATHPVVYAAAGSHASYPVACRSDECSQRLAHSIVPDGGFDGGKAWLYDARRDRCEDGAGPADRSRIRPCLLALPSTRDGTAGVLWNAFPGRWGAAVCADLARICSQIDGPRSPSLQPRFRRPWEAKDGPREKLARARPGPAAADEPPE